MKIMDIPQSGKIGLMVSYKHCNGLCRRTHVLPRDPRTREQLARRDTFKLAAEFWHTLTQEQYAAWSRVAAECHSQKRLNQCGKLLPYQLFSKINCNLADIGQAMVPEPPPVPEFGDNPVTELRITTINGVPALKLTVRGQLVPYLVVQGAAPRSAATNYVDHFTLLGVLADPVNGEADITEMYVRQWGWPRPNSKVFIEAIQQINGWQHLPARFSALLPSP
jgi:hypothetical protein